MYIAMDCPPHSLKPLRTILLETASEEKVGTHLLGFYRESAECRFRPLPGDFRELTLKNVLSGWPDFRPAVQERLTQQVTLKWQAFYTPLARELIADSAAPAEQPPATATRSPDDAVNLIQLDKIPPVRRKEPASRSKLPAGSSEVPAAGSGLPDPLARSKVSAVHGEALVTRDNRLILLSKTPVITIGTAAKRGHGPPARDDMSGVAVEQSEAQNNFFIEPRTQRLVRQNARLCGRADERFIPSFTVKQEMVAFSGR